MANEPALVDDDEVVEPRSRANFGLGLLVGMALGAAAALLLAPESGRITRRRLRRGLSRVRERVGDQIEDLDDRVRREIKRRRS